MRCALDLGILEAHKFRCFQAPCSAADHATLTQSSVSVRHLAGNGFFCKPIVVTSVGFQAKDASPKVFVVVDDFTMSIICL